MCHSSYVSFVSPTSFVFGNRETSQVECFSESFNYTYKVSQGWCGRGEEALGGSSALEDCDVPQLSFIRHLFLFFSSFSSRTMDARLPCNGHVMYNTATHAAEDLRKRGFTVGEVTRGTKGAGVTEETLAQLLPWETTETRCGRDKDRYQRQIREKLREYRRTESGPAEEDG
ncbi:unnamed protein product [Arctogadus glacialis]